MTDLPINVDSAYADDATHPDVKIHQQHHDALHFLYNLWEQAIEDGTGTWPDGSIPFWNDSTQRFAMIDPAIAGSPGPPGDDGASINPMGNWSAVTTYDLLDLVRHVDTTYIALATTTNDPPPSANWQIVAVDGSDGTDGTIGPTGPAGAQGTAGAPGPAEESLEVVAASGASQTLDLANDSFWKITLTADCTITLDDSLGRAVSAITIEFHQGAGSPWEVTWADNVTWFTADGLPPVLGSALDDIAVVSLYQLNGEWRGFSPAATGEPPAVVYPVIGFEKLAAWTDSVNKSTNFVSPNSYQMGNKRVGHVWLVQTMDNVDPSIPTLTGGGVGTWVQGATVLIGTGTTHRRMTHFVGYDAVAGPSAPLTMPNTEALTGVNAIVARTTASPASAATTALAKDVTAAGTTVNVAATLAAADDAANRGVYVLARNTATSTYTPEATWTMDAGTPQTMTGPTIVMELVTRLDAFDTSITGTTSAANQWGLIATELEQGPLV